MSSAESRDAEEPVYAPVAQMDGEGPLTTTAPGQSQNRRLKSPFASCSTKSLRAGAIVFFLCCLLVGLFVATIVPSSGSGRQSPTARRSSLPSASGVKFFLVGMRHGNRNPGQYFKNDTSHEQWAWQGPSQLTSIGRRQAFSLGEFLRKRYGRLISTDWFPDQIKAYSSSAERCQQTLQSCMAGFFPPKGRSLWRPSLVWQPIPYEISDPLLRMYNVKCPHYTTSYQGISEDTSRAANEWLNRDKPLVRYLAQKSGFNSSLSDMGDVADNVMNMKMFNIPLPTWVTNPTLPGYPPKDMFAAISSFAEAHQVLCANDTECARMMSGLWLDNIIQTLQQLRSGQLKQRLVNVYAAHTETVLSLIRLMKTNGVHETPTSAGLILEYTDTPVPAVRFIFHEPDPNNPDVRLAELKSFPYCPGQQWCPLDTFVQNVKGPSFSDWQTACKLPKCALP